MDERVETIGSIITRLGAGDPAGAMDLIEAAIAAAPTDLAFYFLKSEALRQSGELAAAESLLLTIHLDAPDNAEILYRLGAVRLQQDNRIGALEAFDAAALRPNDNPEISLHIGQSLMQLGHLAGAEGALRRAAELDGKSLPGLFSLAFCLARQALNDEATASQEEKLLSDPAQEDIAGSILQFYLANSLYEAAGFLARAMILAQPETAYWSGMLGGILNVLGGYADAADHCRRAVTLEPDAALFLTHLGAAVRHIGEIPDAIRTLQRAIQIEPDYIEANMALANLHLDGARFDEAAQVIDAYDLRTGFQATIKRSVVIAVLDYSPGSPFNILTLLDDLKEFDGEVICVFNDPRMFEDLQSHSRIDKFSFNKFNVGVSRGWNIGINQAEGDTIHILNADLRISVDMLYRMEDWVHTLPDALCVGITAHWMDFSTLQETRFLNTGMYAEAMETDAVSGQILTMHANRLHDAGISFDPRLAPYFGEETDLAYKIRKAGYKVYAVPETDFEHPWGISKQDRPIFCLGRQVNRMRCIVRNKVLLKRKIDAFLKS